MLNYLDLLEDVMTHGDLRETRTGVPAISIFGTQNRYDLRKSFPAITTKKLYWPGVVHELLWFISGNTNVTYLQENNVYIWNEWCDDDGNLGPVYGHQWRDFNSQGIDQLQNSVNLLRTDPLSRRNIVCAWNPAQIDDMALPPCHSFFQFYVANDELSCHMYQRSADLFLGVPFNIASYSLLTCMMAKITGLYPGDFIHSIGDAHVYVNHLDQAIEQLSREPKARPTLWLSKEPKEIDDFRWEHIKLQNYKSHPGIKAPIAV